MNGNPKDSDEGWICPIRGCKKKKNTLYSLTGLAMHMQKYHPGEFEKRLKLNKGRKEQRTIKIIK